jgi:hypothetical protein
MQRFMPELDNMNLAQLKALWAREVGDNRVFTKAVNVRLALRERAERLARERDSAAHGTAPAEENADEDAASNGASLSIAFAEEKEEEARSTLNPSEDEDAPPGVATAEAGTNAEGAPPAWTDSMLDAQPAGIGAQESAGAEDHHPVAQDKEAGSERPSMTPDAEQEHAPVDEPHRTALKGADVVVPTEPDPASGNVVRLEAEQEADGELDARPSTSAEKHDAGPLEAGGPAIEPEPVTRGSGAIDGGAIGDALSNTEPFAEPEAEAQAAMTATAPSPLQASPESRYDWTPRPKPTVEDLRARYLEVLGRPTRSKDRAYLWRQIRGAETGRVAIGPRGAKRGGGRRGALGLESVDDLRARYVAVIGRPTTSVDRDYLIWKIRAAESGKLGVGRRGAGERRKIVSLRVSEEAVEALDRICAQQSVRNRNALICVAVDAYFKSLGALEEARHFSPA